jgi:hypothetical protein
MVFAKAFDLFWLIEPNFKDAARNLHFSWGILEYVAVPVAMVAFWVAFYCTRLKRVRWCRPTIRIWRRFWSLNMPTHNDDEPKPDRQEPEDHGPDEIDVRGLRAERRPRPAGIVVFLVALASLWR